MRIFQTTLLFFVLNPVFAQRSDSSLKISHLDGDFYIFETYNYYKDSRIPANGMYLITRAGAVLFDSPWDTTQFQPLLDTIKNKHKQNVIMCIATHFHADRTGGLEYYRRQGIKTYTTLRTDELSKKYGMKRAQFVMSRDTVFSIGQYSFQIFYPGHGHTSDNIVAWFQDQKILYGGCLIKSIDDKNLGNLADASEKEYVKSLENVRRKFSDPLYVIPGHNSWRSTRSLQHTIEMARRLRKR